MSDKKEGEEWIALGHGMGALGLLDLMNRFDESIKGKIDRLILSNFVLNFSSPFLQIQDRLLENLSTLNSLMSSTRPMEIYRAEEILSETRDQALYLEDPLIVRRPTSQTFRNINFKVKSIYQDAYFLDKPTLVLKSESPYILKNGMDSFSKGFKKGFLTEKKYSNLKHDLYNEKENQIVFNDIAEWVQK